MLQVFCLVFQSLVCRPDKGCDPDAREKQTESQAVNGTGFGPGYDAQYPTAPPSTLWIGVGKIVYMWLLSVFMCAYQVERFVDSKDLEDLSFKKIEFL